MHCIIPSFYPTYTYNAKVVTILFLYKFQTLETNQALQHTTKLAFFAKK